MLFPCLIRKGSRWAHIRRTHQYVHGFTTPLTILISNVATNLAPATSAVQSDLKYRVTAVSVVHLLLQLLILTAEAEEHHEHA